MCRWPGGPWEGAQPTPEPHPTPHMPRAGGLPAPGVMTHFIPVREAARSAGLTLSGIGEKSKMACILIPGQRCLHPCGRQILGIQEQAAAAQASQGRPARPCFLAPEVEAHLPLLLPPWVWPAPGA